MDNEMLVKLACLKLRDAEQSYLAFESHCLTFGLDAEAVKKIAGGFDAKSNGSFELYGNAWDDYFNEVYK